LKERALILFVFLLISSIVGCVAVATAQDTVHPLLALSSNEIIFYAEENGDSQSADLILVGLAAGEGVNVRIVTSKLYDNSSGQAVDITLQGEDDDDFNLLLYDERPVTVTLNPSGEKAGTYEGVLMITATNKTATEEILTTNIKVKAIIKGAAFWYNSTNLQVILIIFAIVPMIIGLVIPDKEFRARGIKYSKKPWLVFLGAISVFSWLASFVSFSFKEPSTIINTVVVTPFLTYVISFVKDKRTERLDKEKTSRTIRDEGIKEDVKLIRDLIGEMATHCASFTPNFYAKKMQRFHAKKKTVTLNYDPRLLYPKTGILERKVWEKSCRQGFVADIHTLHLEKYYDLIPLYNQYYSDAMERVETIDPTNSVPIDDLNFFRPFEAFRETYGKLQKVLFVYLTYILELYSKTTLTPMKLEFPRITRTLLYKLIEYRILIPWDFIDGFRRKDLKEFGKKQILEEMKKNNSLQHNCVLQSKDDPIDVFKDRYKSKTEWLKEFKESNPELEEGTDEFNKAFNEWLVEFFKKNNPELETALNNFQKGFAEWRKNNVDDVVAIEVWLTKFFENRIEWWLFTADDLDRIVEYIYQKDRVPHFFRHVQDDFQRTYLELKECIKALPKPKATTKTTEIKEYKISLGNIQKDKNGTLITDPFKLVLGANGKRDAKKEPLKRKKTKRK